MILEIFLAFFFDAGACFLLLSFCAWFLFLSFSCCSIFGEAFLCRFPKTTTSLLLVDLPLFEGRPIFRFPDIYKVKKSANCENIKFYKKTTTKLHDATMNSRHIFRTNQHHQILLDIRRDQMISLSRI